MKHAKSAAAAVLLMLVAAMVFACLSVSAARNQRTKQQSGVGEIAMVRERPVLEDRNKMVIVDDSEEEEMADFMALEDPNKLCMGNAQGGFDCCMHVDRKIGREHINFTLCINMHTNMTERSADIVIKYNEKVLYDKKMLLSQLTVPVCLPLPLASSLGIKLCALFSDVRFSSERNCFSATAAVQLKVLFVGKIHLLKPMPFGYHAERCRDIPLLRSHGFKKARIHNLRGREEGI